MNRHIIRITNQSLLRSPLLLVRGFSVSHLLPVCNLSQQETRRSDSPLQSPSPQSTHHLCKYAREKSSRRLSGRDSTQLIEETTSGSLDNDLTMNGDSLVLESTKLKSVSAYFSNNNLTCRCRRAKSVSFRL